MLLLDLLLKLVVEVDVVSVELCWARLVCEKSPVLATGSVSLSVPGRLSAVVNSQRGGRLVGLLMLDRKGNLDATHETHLL